MSLSTREMEGYRYEHAEQAAAIERNRRAGFDPTQARLQDEALITNERELNTMSAQSNGTLRIQTTQSNGASDPTPAPLPQFTVNVIIDGFPVKVETSGNANHLVSFIGRLRDAGATPPAWASGSTQRAPEAPHVPMCPDHHREMKESEKKPGSYYCTKKTNSGGYCRQQT